jgi:hypothetical protein
MPRPGRTTALVTRTAFVTSADAVGVGQAMWRPEMDRAMTSCWICSVPSKMS